VRIIGNTETTIGNSLMAPGSCRIAALPISP
jgi:hypothetical protein